MVQHYCYGDPIYIQPFACSRVFLFIHFNLKFILERFLNKRRAVCRWDLHSNSVGPLVHCRFIGSRCWAISIAFCPESFASFLMGKMPNNPSEGERKDVGHGAIDQLLRANVMLKAFECNCGWLLLLTNIMKTSQH